MAIDLRTKEQKRRQLELEALRRPLVASEQEELRTLRSLAWYSGVALGDR